MINPEQAISPEEAVTTPATPPPEKVPVPPTVAPFSDPIPQTPPEPRKRQGETMEAKKKRPRYQTTVYLDPTFQTRISQVHHRLALMVVNAGKGDLEKFDVWESILLVGLAHMDEVENEIKSRKGL